MKTTQYAMVAIAAVAVALTGTLAWAEDPGAAGQRILEKNQEAVITVVTVVGISWGGDDQERELEANATVIGEDGLSVMALSAVDPTKIFKTFNPGQDGPKSTVKSMKMIMNDGTEIESEVILRDTDLDLAFVRPAQPAGQPLAYVDISQTATLEVLEPFVVIGQLGKVSRRAHCVFIERVEAIVEKPRLFYVPPAHRTNAIICSPVFAMDGKFVGIGVMRAIRSGGSGGERSVIIVPAVDIAESAKQAPPYEED